MRPAKGSTETVAVKSPQAEAVVGETARSAKPGADPEKAIAGVTGKQVPKPGATNDARRTPKARRASGAKLLAPAGKRCGLDLGQIGLGLAHADVAPLVGEVEAAGGAALGAYREPLSGRPILLAALPLSSVEPTPFQRDLSPAHTKRLAQKIEETGSFLDPLIVVRGANGRFWTPNGRHRLAAAGVLGLKQITALVSPNEDLAFKILALNTEKPHSLKDRCLEVVRMATALAERNPRAKESEFAVQFEAPELLTLGCAYEEDGRFAGGAYGPLLRKVDRFSDRTLVVCLRERIGYAARLLEIDAQLTEMIEVLQDRGFRSPYLRHLIVARLNPVRFHRPKKSDASPPMALGTVLNRMATGAKAFDLDSVRAGDLALIAAVSSDEE